MFTTFQDTTSSRDVKILKNTSRIHKQVVEKSATIAFTFKRIFEGVFKINEVSLAITHRQYTVKINLNWSGITRLSTENVLPPLNVYVVFPCGIVTLYVLFCLRVINFDGTYEEIENEYFLTYQERKLFMVSSV